MRKKFKYIFVVVTYKNAEDLYDLNKSIKKYINDYLVIIVNNHFDDNCDSRIKYISKELNYQYISSENLGYGHGNNIGISFAEKNYDYQYLIICNSDTIIQDFDDSKLPASNTMIGPMIVAKDGKFQNPYWVFNSKFLEYIMYKGKKNNSYFLMYINIIINKLFRILFNLFYKNKIKNIYAVHGSFLIYTRDVIKKNKMLYDNNMFLYNEEAYIANKMRKNNINCIYYPLIRIFHKEDGSTGGKIKNINKITSDSYIYYYEKYKIRGDK